MRVIIIIFLIINFSSVSAQILSEQFKQGYSEKVKKQAEEIEDLIESKKYRLASEKIDNIDVENPDIVSSLQAKLKTAVNNDKKEEGIKWLGFNEASELSKKQPKSILFIIDFRKQTSLDLESAKKRFENDLRNEKLVKYVNEHYYAVRYYVDESNLSKDKRVIKYKGFEYSLEDFMIATKVNGCPTMLFFDEKSDYISKHEGYEDIKRLEFFLDFYGTGKYSKFKSQEEFNKYKESFDYKF